VSVVQRGGRRQGVDDALELFERLEQQMEDVFRARRVTRSARQVADMIGWLREQPEDRLLLLAALGGALLIGLGIFGLTQRPETVNRMHVNKRKADRPRRV